MKHTPTRETGGVVLTPHPNPPSQGEGVKQPGRARARQAMRARRVGVSQTQKMKKDKPTIVCGI